MVSELSAWSNCSNVRIHIVLSWFCISSFLYQSVILVFHNNFFVELHICMVQNSISYSREL